MNPPKQQDSKIDINNLSINELLELQRDINTRLGQSIFNPGDQSAVVLYSIQLITSKGTVSNNSGMYPLNGIFEYQALPEAPTLFANTFQSHIWRPIRNDFFKLANNNSNSNLGLPNLDASEEPVQ